MNRLKTPDIDTDDLITIDPDQWGAMARALGAFCDSEEELGARVIYDLMLEIQAQVIARDEQPQFELAPAPDPPKGGTWTTPPRAELELSLIHALMNHGQGSDSVKLASEVVAEVWS